MTPTARRRARAGLGMAVVIGAIALLRPWTVRPIEVSQPIAFDASRFVEDAWPKVVAEAERRAVDLADVKKSAVAPAGGGAAPRRAMFVKATGIVVEVDRRSRVGVVRLRVQGTLPAEVGVLVGPVLKGTALRDAASFLRFSDFANQTEFAAVSNGLNDQALRRVIAPVDLDGLPGQTVTVVGAGTLSGNPAEGVIELVPLKLVVGGGGR